jgi:amino acid transporter
MQAIGLALGIGAVFYALSIAAVAYIAPWQSLLGKRFATAIAFEHGIGKHWIVQLILVMALFGLFQCFNGNFAASTRLLFAFGRRGTVAPQFATIHEKFATPSIAVVGITAGTLLGLLLGDSILVPITEVGSMASALGWLAACASFWFVERRLRMRLITALGICVSLLLLLMKLIPAFPGHFTHAEWIALAVWLFLGAILHRRPSSMVEPEKLST